MTIQSTTDTPKILLVDDRPENLMILQKSLRACNAQCIIAESGNEALKKILIHDFALAILDVQMPEMDGYELAHIIRNNDQTKNLPIIFLSAVYSDDFHIFKGYESGGVDFISKPYEPQLLQSKVDVFLSLYLHRREIELSRELYAKTFDAISDTVMLLNNKFEVIRVNRSGCYLLNLHELDIVGKCCYELFEERDTPCDGCLLAEQLGGAITPAIWEIEHTKMQRCCRVSVAPLVPLTESNMIVYSVQDITNQKRMQERLVQMEKLEAIGSLAGGIAHDFNNILAVILGNTELSLLDVDLNERIKNYLSQVHQAGKRAKELVAQILTYSRESHFKPIPILVQPVLKEALTLLRSTMPQGITLKSEICKSNDKILAAPLQIHQVVMNLCTNSFHTLAGEKGVVEVNLFRKKSGEGGSDLVTGPCLHLQVKDDGSGMDEKLQTKIFEPFFTTKPEGMGTGMGLAIVKKVIFDCNGDITVTSEIGQGTTFDIYFPITSKKNQKINSKRITALYRGSGCVLVVDDDQMIRNVLKNTLEFLGYEAVTVGSAKRAIDVFKEEPDKFSIVLTDQEMPGTTGEELMPELLAIRPDLPIIISTGHSTRMSADKAKKLGARDYLIKPIEINTLAASLKNILDK